MNKIFPFIFSIIVIITVQSCSKKNLPNNTAVRADKMNVISPEVKKNDLLVAKRSAIKRNPAPPLPKVIIVNDKFANTSVDGRLYYDLQGHRYWRNYKDGKYYLFNKSMQTDHDFKKPGQK